MTKLLLMFHSSNWASIIAFVSCTTLTTSSLLGQGCSDAGFCSISSMKPNEADSAYERKNQIKTGVYYGQASNAIVVYGNYLEYRRQLSSHMAIDFKLASLSQNGNGISTFGMADAIVNASYRVNDHLFFSAGLKVPFDDGNQKLNGLSLPMDYQTSLGTTDLVIGFGYSFRRLQLVAGFQQPITQNKNAFIADLYPKDSKIRNFQSTNQFERSGDILLRASYPVKLSNKLKLTPSILPIYHLSNDQFTDTKGDQKAIQGSQGLTLNGNLFADIDFNTRNAIQINVGMPFIVREARPDGLSRSLVANLEYKIKF